jgi:hypothetical protein
MAAQRICNLDWRKVVRSNHRKGGCRKRRSPTRRASCYTPNFLFSVLELHPINLPERNGTAPATALSPEAANSSGRLHGAKPPKWEIVEEKPWHFAAALMFARGEVTSKEVAEAFDVSPVTVRNLLRQPWFQERVTKLMVEHGGRDIMQLFRAEGFNSLVTLVEIRDDTKVSASVRSANARDILDRALGKPIQRIEQSNLPTSADPVDEVKRLEEANERLRASSSSNAAEVAGRASDKTVTRP